MTNTEPKLTPDEVARADALDWWDTHGARLCDVDTVLEQFDAFLTILHDYRDLIEETAFAIEKGWMNTQAQDLSYAVDRLMRRGSWMAGGCATGDECALVSSAARTMIATIIRADDLTSALESHALLGVHTDEVCRQTGCCERNG